MSNKEKYKRAFSVIHTSNNFSLEVERMENLHKRSKFRKTVVYAVACVMILGGVTIAYASDFVGVRRTIRLWVYGEQTEATIEFDESGNYNLDYIDSEGNHAYRSGGGVAIDNEGNEIPLSEEELMSDINAPDVEYKDDGSVWVYWQDQKVDITDKFDDGFCFIKLTGIDGETLYITIKYNGGYGIGEHDYPPASMIE